MLRRIIYYLTKDNKCPIVEFLDSLEDKVTQKITWTLQIIREAKRIPSIYLKKLKNTNDIWECRIVFASNIYRIFCFFDNGSIIVLTHGIVKKTQKTPKKEIKLAEAYKKDYQSRRRKKNG